MQRTTYQILSNENGFVLTKGRHHTGDIFYAHGICEYLEPVECFPDDWKGSKEKVLFSCEACIESCQQEIHRLQERYENSQVPIFAALAKFKLKELEAYEGFVDVLIEEITNGEEEL